MIRRCAVIPAYNEEVSLRPLLKKIREHNVDVIIVDDGSTDGTASIARSEGVFLISHTSNEGKGSSLRDGFKLALDKGYDEIITMDADNQHSAAEIPLFIKKAHDKTLAVITGNRLNNPKGMPLSRLFVNRLFSKIVSAVCKQDIPDALCGFRIIKRQVLQSISLGAGRFDIDPEILIKASRMGFRVGSVEIESIYANEMSHIRPFRDAHRFFKLIAEEARNRPK